MRLDIEPGIEPTCDDTEPLGKIIGDPRKEKVNARRVVCMAIAPRGQEFTVE
jgi:hypothetical protein